MGAFAVGQVVVLPFPFSDSSSKKYRPALLLAHLGKGDWVACQITSNAYADSTAIELHDHDFKSGSLQRLSYVRIGKLFTAHESFFSCRRVAKKRKITIHSRKGRRLNSRRLN